MARKSKRIIKSRRAGRKPVYRRRATRHTAVGRIFPPVDVRNKGSLGEVLKRIRAGPITIMLVYADWCGHCKHFKPHFDAASRSPNRTVQAVEVSDKAFPAVNAAIQGMNGNASGLPVEAYPTVLLLDNKGNRITEINAVNDTKVMKGVMEQAGENAESVALSSPKPPRNSTAPRTLNTFNSAAVKSTSAASSGRASLPTNPDMDEITSLPAVVSTRSESAEEAASQLIQPPSNEEDIITSVEGQRGGSLYSALASSAYKLAPAAILLGLAATTMRRHRRGKGRKSLRRHRR
jgi:thiol-disulfide isomerase/thioredoxin